MKKISIITFGLLLVIAVAVSAQTNEPAKLPADRVGQIGAPLGKIAFIRSGDLWVMDWDGRNQFKVVSVTNAEGGLSWAPDGKRIVFPRKGSVDVRGPAGGMGGQHKIYDIFIGYLDSARAKNTNWWFMLTGEMGARHPQWTKDGSKIIFTQDLNANKVNALRPNYQIAWIDTSGGDFHVFRTDYNNYSDSSLINVTMPTLGPDNKYACVMYLGTNQIGIGISSLDKKTLDLADIGKSVKLIRNATAPAWSPDGNWIAYVDPDISRQGIYIVSPDLSEKFLVYKPAPGQTLQTYPPSWSPDSKWITFATGDGSIWVIDVTGNGLKQLSGAGLNLSPVWSKNK